MDSSIQPWLDAEWQKLRERNRLAPPDRPATPWSYRLTPPLPSDWPPNNNSLLIYYAYAEGRDSNLMDGVRVAAPWARIEKHIAHLALPKMELLAEEIHSIGAQGVRPISRDELVLADSGVQIESYLAALAGSFDENSRMARGVKEYYRFWRANNGVIAAEVLPLHPDFFKWLVGI